LRGIKASLPSGKTEAKDVIGDVQYGPGSASSTSIGILPSVSPRRFSSTVGGVSNIIHFAKKDIAAITIILDEDEIRAYYNGNQMFRLPLEGISISAKDFAIKQNMVKDGNINNIIAYNRILTKEEIVQNSIALL
jgi:hypothetical protein